MPASEKRLLIEEQWTLGEVGDAQRHHLTLPPSELMEGPKSQHETLGDLNGLRQGGLGGSLAEIQRSREQGARKQDH